MASPPVISLTSSAPDVVAVSGSVTAAGLKAGTASLIARSGQIASNAVSVNVTAPQDTTLASIELTCSADGIEIGGTSTCTARGLNAAGTVLTSQPTFEFRSSNAGVATVSASGVVTGVMPGQTSLTARSGSVTSPAFSLTVTEPAARGTMQVTVRDAATRSALSGVNFDFCRTTQACVTVRPADNPAGVYNLDVPSDTYARLIIRKDGYRNGEYLNLTVPAGQTTVLEPFLALNQAIQGDGTVQGRILNATTGTALAGVTITASAGLGGGQVTQSVTSDASGRYSLTLPTGYYSLSASKSGYISTSSTVSVIGQQTLNVGDRALSPELTGNGEWRFVLNWGAEPSDLDSHLTGPLADGRRFHVAFYAPISTDSLGSVNLDVDDTSSYGPETITVTETPEGLLRYSVHDYSNQGDSQSGALSSSGARVQVFRGTALVATYNVPNGQGDLWTVFTLDLTDPNVPKLVPVNTISTVGDSDQVQRTPGVKQPISLP
ncbi:carboxypeptidase regulatory-like domain-containing protein [Deinococcus aquaticus]|uniref:Carboxypeptidase regulatory-like domain-containing protein n=1 Tax=Deinococcus aquaticus TaxID=328692 RepID=A0ABY7UY13_9DEIO|nr:carboxypeptidase regulatory-like domain-containing protein [Deinococcus aquaticus]WDA57264.1 carboxypeptidase regulatory-like domain-containing protein [Deinococcus aquaticus]